MRSYTHHTDEQLAELLCAADQAAFTELYSRYWERMVAIAFTKLQSVTDAKEVVQEVFFDLWKRREQLEIRQTFGAWISGAVKYKILTFLARSQRRTDQERSLPEQPYHNNTEEYQSYQDLRAQLQASVAALPEKCRLVFRLSREQGLSLREIAAQLDISQKTAEAHLTKALKTLRSQLQQFSCFL